MHSILQDNNEPITLIYPDVTVRNVSFNFTVNESICENSLSRKMTLLRNGYFLIHEQDITATNGQIHIEYFNSFEIQTYRDFGNSFYTPFVCDNNLIQYMISYVVLYRPNITMNIVEKNYTRDETLIINGNITDWDSLNLNLTVLLNDNIITKKSIVKNSFIDDVPYNISLSLREAKLGNNNLTLIATDTNDLSSYKTKVIYLEGIRPNITSNDDINRTYTIGDDINFKISINHLDSIEYFEVLYSIDDDNDWNLYQKINTTNETVLPFDIIVNLKGIRLTDRYHSIKVKLIDSNRLESNIYLSIIIS